ncbi:CocE/NonD family hydrolase [Nisaea acidiphila]|uniref:CocE/NonD family hydrolase n=1 Tax=Nisaea acidiphila TaxID=1862145 RepID=A0A9J7AYY3_9PROT|nr:CocE/NonD family hydrolase [Nisaea acidiphila]UUX51476.1 CocE/NonD family hydrolase [Nisaea acidiphila]
MKIVGQFPHQVREIENTWITLSDGCRLAARIWLPEGAENAPVPAILEYLPYRKRDGTSVRDALTHPYFAGHGYAAVRVDMRGNGESDGIMEDEYLPQEQDDCLEVIDWLVKQPWCSGAVGMIGISWGGFNGLQVAFRQPEALKAVITLCSTDDRYADDIHYKGGAMLNENMGWSSTMLSYSSRPPDPALVGESWRETWLKRLEAEPLLIANWLKHQTRDAFWKHGSICEDYSKVAIPVLAVGGWSDAYSNAVPRMLEKLPGFRRGIVGPWLHKYPHFAVPGPAIGFLQESLRWWDQWLKGIDRGVEADPMFRVYMQASVPPKAAYETRDGRWCAEPAWPSPNVSRRHFHLGDGALSEAGVPTGEAVIRSPETVGQAGGEYCMIWLGPEGPTDQRIDDAGSVCFDTVPLEGPFEILGAAELDLELASDQPVAHLIGRLNDVAPDGTSTRITYGVLNLTHRKSHERPEELEPGRSYRIRLKLDDVAYAVPKGHRIRLALSTSYWPMIWPAPEAATLTLKTGPSVLNLPERNAEENAAPYEPFEEAEAAPPLEKEILRPARNTRTVTTDIESGRQKIEIFDDFGRDRIVELDLTTGHIARETYSIQPGDPLSARMETHWSQELSRGDWDVATETYCTLTGDATHFHVTGRIEAYEAGKLIFAKDFDESVPRNFL